MNLTSPPDQLNSLKVRLFAGPRTDLDQKGLHRSAVQVFQGGITAAPAGDLGLASAPP